MITSKDLTQSHQNAKLGFHIVDSRLLNISGPVSSIPAHKFSVAVLATEKDSGPSVGFMDKLVAHVAHAS
jgi:hypothetical protein